MNIVQAVIIAEGQSPAEDSREYLEAWQTLVNTGVVWSLQGWFGRTAVALIEAGEISVRRDS